MTKNYFTYGYHALRLLLLTKPQLIKRLLISENRQDARVQEIIGVAQQQHIAIDYVSLQQLNEQTSEAVHQGMIAITDLQPSFDEKDLTLMLQQSQQHMVVLALDSIQDPHNLGAILRSAAAFNVMAVVVPKRNAVSVTPTVRKVACGGAELVPVITVTNLKRTLKQIQEYHFWIVGLAGEATTPLQTIDLTGNIVLVMGNESQGMRRLVSENCDYLAHINVDPLMDSLNVSVATGIALYEVSRQRATKLS